MTVVVVVGAKFSPQQKLGLMNSLTPGACIINLFTAVIAAVS
jgi:hypothetical protein